MPKPSLVSFDMLTKDVSFFVKACRPFVRNRHYHAPVDDRDHTVLVSAAAISYFSLSVSTSSTASFVFLLGCFVPISPAPYHAITAIPKNALKQLKTIATVPLTVNPAGSGGGDLLAPLRSKRSLVLPAALPAMGTSWAAQAARWSCGIVRVFCRKVGASIIVATRPEATCHSTWQWKSQMRDHKNMLARCFSRLIWRRETYQDYQL